MILLEVFICLLTPYPFFIGITISEHNIDYMIVVKYELNDYLTTFMFARVYLLFWFFITFS